MSEYSIQNKVKLVRGGKEYFHMLIKLINEARDYIHLQAYIFKNDNTGKEIIKVLKSANKRGVDVYLLADGYASQDLPKAFIQDLEKEGIHFRLFEPLFKSESFYFGRRMHHKIIVIDGTKAIIGGVNIADRYNDFPDHPAWLDFTVYVEGEVVKEICVLCWKTWNSFPLRMIQTPCEKKEHTFTFQKGETSLVRMRRNDWVRRKNEISNTYLEILKKAEKNILIVCSYFLPGRVITRQMQKALKRGVKITVVTAGISDIMLAKNAERWLYDRLLRLGINILEYQPSILHAKLAICDEEWITIGSYNINDISAYASIELNLDIKDVNFTSAVKNTIDNIIRNDCVQITAKMHKKNKNIFVQFLRWISYYTIQVIFHLATFYFKRENIKHNNLTDKPHY